MSITDKPSKDYKIQNTFIEWDTVRGRGDFDAGYVNEFYYLNKQGEIDEQKRRQFEDNPQYRLIQNQKSRSSHRHRSRDQNTQLQTTASDSQIIKKVKKTRTVKLSKQKQSVQCPQSKSVFNLADI